MIFDTHAHYDDRAFDDDRDRLLEQMRSHGIGRIVNVTSDYASQFSSLELASRYDFIYTSVGLHPTEVYEFTTEESDSVSPDGRDAERDQASAAVRDKEPDRISEDRQATEVRSKYGSATEALDIIRELASRPKVVAIGEIGLDYHYDDTDRSKQLYFFRAQLDMAAKLELPVIIHSRDAAAETFDIMKEYADRLPGGVIHCYSYSYDMAAEYVKMGYHIGIGGVVTFKNSRKLKECAAKLPLESIVIETDCPYLAPAPHRGERNSSLYLPLVVREIAQLRSIAAKDVEAATWDNGCRLYGLQ